MESSILSENSDAKEKEVAIIKDIISTLPLENGWKSFQPLCLYQGFWNFPSLVKANIFSQQNFKPQPDDIFLCSAPKTGTTWLKALAFATVTRTHFNNSQNPLLTKLPHDCVPFLEVDLIQNPTAKHDPNLPLWSTHFPYSSLPKSIIGSGNKIIYIWRDPKDVFVSLWHFSNKLKSNNGRENVSLEEAFDLFCKGICLAGPYWDHVLGYWKASLERPDKVLILKYEEMMEDTAFHLKRLAKFMGYPFSLEEENEDAVQRIVELSSFDNLINLEVNKTGKYVLANGKIRNSDHIKNEFFFRNGKVGDWKNYLSFEMGQRLDKIMEEKLSGSGLK